MAQPRNGENSVLWKVTAPHNKHTSYLLGTAHYLGDAWLNSFPVIATLLNGSDTFIAENLYINDTLGKAKLIKTLSEDKRSTKELLGDKYKLIDDYLTNESGTSVAVLDSTDEPKLPILLTLSYSLLTDIAKKLHLKVSGNTALLDNILITNAQASKKNCMGLDSQSDLTETFKSDFSKTVVDNLAELIRMSAPLSKLNQRDRKKMADLTAFLQKYNRGIYSYTFTKAYPADLKDGLANRNSHWMKQLPGLIKGRNCFIAVGAAHLNYQHGIIQELVKRGFTVVPVPLK